MTMEDEEEGVKSARDSWDKRQRLLLKDRFDVRVKATDLEFPQFLFVDFQFLSFFS